MRVNESGFTRNDCEGKPRYDLIPPWVLTRLAKLYARGADKFGERNWELADSEEDFKSGHASFLRHVIQYFNDENDEDHFAAAIWNLILCEHVKTRLEVRSLYYNPLPTVSSDEGVCENS